MGPTASGKTHFAISLCKRFPCDIISVDSALVYRGMDIGTAKPDTETLKRAPHRLVDIRNPEESYSAGEFVRDARREMDDIFARRRIPLLVGGTMMYFRALTEGIAELPMADKAIRREIDAIAEKSGWPAVHAELKAVDAVAAERINPNDSQRIQRALEVYKASGKTLTEWQQESGAPAEDIKYIKIALQIEPRKLLHERIALRLDHMIDGGFVDELRRLRERPGVTRNSPAMRSVGYRQFWGYLENEYSLIEARDRALFATRQLAKRQLTWLRSEQSIFTVNPLEVGAIDTISRHLAQRLG
ncbi:MAG: tRNA (adenosine(37)-N6)-dimethylallyltransferase MiaA [Gammaproteobacteria bacterium]|nr:tRNA (adenosine(37)-N6)-dimethylallyltransferase MiaA [Gammaproteobacteria bacterium]MDH3480949.1 tRNA (adenosine(37)-N6)-dimethylallyltransferase MiaA [Gammaproteobacteria bacterium]